MKEHCQWLFRQYYDCASLCLSYNILLIRLGLQKQQLEATSTGLVSVSALLSKGRISHGARVSSPSRTRDQTHCVKAIPKPPLKHSLWTGNDSAWPF